MTITDTPNAANRDGYRETALLDLGIDTPVIHDGLGRCMVTLPVRKLDEIIERMEGPDRHHADEDDLAIAYEDGVAAGRAQVMVELEEFAATKKATAS